MSLAPARSACAACCMRPPFSGSSPTLMSPTLGSTTPCTRSMKRDAIRANCRMLCSSASIVAPASRRHAGFPREVGSIPQSAGRSMPRMRPSVMSAAAIVAPVFPAETTASASPVFTITVATPIDVSPRLRSAFAGCSSIATTSRASRTAMPSRSVAPSARRSASSRPTSTRSAGPPFSRYNSAPRTISSGAWSPPIASTAILIPLPGRLCGPLRLDLNDLAAAERAAMRTRLMRWLGAPALRAWHERHRPEGEVAPPLALCCPRDALLRMSGQIVLLSGLRSNSIGSRSRLFALRVEVAQLLEPAPALVGGVLVFVRVGVQVAAAHLAEPPAVGPAERRERRCQDELLPQQRCQVDAEIAADGLRVGRRRIVPAVSAHHVDRREVLLREGRLHRRLDRGEAAAALLCHVRLRLALEIRAGVRVGREDVGVDRRRARVEQPGVLATRVDGRLVDVEFRLRADRLLQQRCDVDLHARSPLAVAFAPRALRGSS